jgi:uncharacterized membrane protein YhhN
VTSQTGTVGRIAAAPVLLTGFFVFALVHLGLQLADIAPWVTVTKPLPALCLLAYALMTGRHRLVAFALLFSAAADVALDLDGWFIAGVVLFGLAHVSYLIAFARLGARPRVPVIVAYLLVWGATMWWLWPGLDSMRVQLAVYSLLVTAMAIMASGLTWRTALGGALFVVSDGLIAAGMAGWHELPQQDTWVMVTYFAAQFLLTTGSPARRSP